MQPAEVNEIHGGIVVFIPLFGLDWLAQSDKRVLFVLCLWGTVGVGSLLRFITGLFVGK